MFHLLFSRCRPLRLRNWSACSAGLTPTRSEFLRSIARVCSMSSVECIDRASLRYASNPFAHDTARCAFHARRELEVERLCQLSPFAIVLVVRQWVLSSLDLFHPGQRTLVQVSHESFQPEVPVGKVRLLRCIERWWVAAASDDCVSHHLLHQRLRSRRDSGFLHCLNLFVLSVDVTHHEPESRLVSCNSLLKCFHCCHRCERSRFSVLSLSSSTPGSNATVVNSRE